MNYTDSELDAIDAMVAEHLFGWKFYQNYSHSGIRQVQSVAPNKKPDYDDMQPVDGSALAGSWKIGRVPEYTRSGDAMLAVVEKMRATWSVGIVGRGDGWHCSLMLGDGAYESGAAPTIPLAVALAALAAVGKPYERKAT